MGSSVDVLKCCLKDFDILLSFDRHLERRERSEVFKVGS
jgi:hypothetical protein